MTFSYFWKKKNNILEVIINFAAIRRHQCFTILLHDRICKHRVFDIYKFVIFKRYQKIYFKMNTPGTYVVLNLSFMSDGVRIKLTLDHLDEATLGSSFTNNAPLRNFHSIWEFTSWILITTNLYLFLVLGAVAVRVLYVLSPSATRVISKGYIQKTRDSYFKMPSVLRNEQSQPIFMLARAGPPGYEAWKTT